MPTIRKLPVGLINKIAAGEVIERPASVVKELLENSIDAGATSVELTVEGGGVDLIRITDNGCGISEDQLELAIAPHATSKLATSEDLFDVRTLGFRGEALASIAEISHLTMRSRTSESDSGFELVVKGGEPEPVRPCSAPVGTTIEVRHLFFNTPVRRKFLKSSQTEMGHVVEAFTRIALAFPHVQLKLISQDRVLHDLLPTERWSERIRAFFGDEVADALIPIDQRDEHVGIRGYVTDPSVSRANNRMQYLFLNGRYIRDRSLQHALGEAYRGLLMVGRMPVCFIHVDLDPKGVDVNVHPTKVEVRFEDSGAVYSRLLGSIRTRFLKSDLVARVRNPAEAMPVPAFEPAFAAASPIMQHDASERSLMNWAQSNLPHHSNVPRPESSFGRSVPEFRPFPGEASNLIGRQATLESDPFHTSARLGAQLESSLATLECESSGTPNALASSGVTQTYSPSDHFNAPTPESIQGSPKRIGFQFHNRYLVTEDESGIVIIDQHALHERIMFEQIKSKVLSKSLERQRLLVPEPVNLTASEASSALEARETLSELGIDIEPFGGDTILVTSYPAILSKFSCAEILRQVLEPFMSGGKKVDARNLLDELMNMMACKAAVKAGDKLSEEEIQALLEQRELYHDTHHCPHGRPTALFFSREQLDKMFKRI